MCKELVFVRSPGESMGSNNDREHWVPEVVRHLWELEVPCDPDSIAFIMVADVGG